MSKTLFTAALAFVLSIGGMVLSAEDLPISHFLNAKMDVSLKDNLTASAFESGKTFGYKKDGGGFVSLATAMQNATVTGSKASVQLGTFSNGEAFQFGFANNAGGDFTAASVKVMSDPGYYTGYSAEGFYHLDFSKDPFDGKIDILVMGEPLPPSTVTLLVALAAAAAFLLYNNRRTRANCTEQV